MYTNPPSLLSDSICAFYVNIEYVDDDVDKQTVRASIKSKALLKY